MHTKPRLASHAQWLLSGILLLAIGCSERAEVTLTQPAAPPAERQLVLRSDHAFFATFDGWEHLLVALPAPSAVADTRDFVIYVRQRDPSQGVESDAVEFRSPGFLIQTVGLRAGRSNFTFANISRPRSWISSSSRRYQVDLTCVDGSHISGDILAQPRPDEIRAFIRRHAADIELLRATSQPTTAPTTGPVPD